VYVPNGLPREILVMGMGFLAGDELQWECHPIEDFWPAPEVHLVVPVDPLVDLNALFVAPFHVE
jgi:hypothetical protein